MRAAAALLAIAFALAVPEAKSEANACPFAPELGMKLAGPDTVDCGIALMGTLEARNRIVECARGAIAAGRPVRFGVGSGNSGLDVFDCDVVVVDRAHRYWLIVYTYDTSTGDDARPEASVMRCPNIDLTWKDPGNRGRFGPRNCVDDPDAFARSKIFRP